MYMEVVDLSVNYVLYYKKDLIRLVFSSKTLVSSSFEKDEAIREAFF